jgi:peptidyl-prolyl cis-trans isomerase C
MKRCLIGLLAVAALIAQAPQSPPQAGPSTPGQSAPKPPALMSLPPDTVVATVDGQKVTASQLQVILRALAPAQQEAATRSPQSFLEQFGLMRRLSEMAEKEGLDQKSPTKEQLAYNRMLALAQTKLVARETEVKVTPEDVKTFYGANPDVFTTTRVKVIYIPFSPNAAAPQEAAGKKVLTEKEAQAKADKLYADLKAGADFVKLVKAHSEDTTSASKDGDFGTFRRSDRLPVEIKSAVFALKQGEVSQPVRQPNGFYLFRAEETGVEPLEKVRDQIVTDLRNTRFNEWVQGTQKTVQVKIENEAAFAPPAPAAVK